MNRDAFIVGTRIIRFANRSA